MGTEVDEIKVRIRRVLKEVLPNYDDGKNLRDQIDSLGLFSLIPRLESEFHIGIFSIEMDTVNLRSVDSLAELIGRKLIQREG